jgi:[ribosomal protein S5]-alanine N-acetyltransferase
MFQLHTTRLILQHIQASDDEALHHAIFNDPEVMRFGDGIQAKEWVQNWLTKLIAQYDEHGYGAYVIVEKVSGKVIGYCGLFHFPDVNGQPEVEIGYRLARSSWGKGYATEAAVAVRDHAFRTLGMNRLIAIIDPSNTGSIRVAEKLGMHYAEDVMFEGYSHSDHVYVITRG